MNKALTSTQRAHLVEALKLAEELENVSPIRAFLDQCCIVDPGESVPTDKLFAAWEAWCMTTAKREHIGTTASFGAALYAALPSLRKTRPRDAAGKRTWTYGGLSIGSHRRLSRSPHQHTKEDGHG